MRRKKTYIDPTKLKFQVKIWFKCRNRFCENLKFQILATKFWKKIVSKIVRQNQNLNLQNHDFDIEFGVWVLKIHFEKSKIVFLIPLETHFETIKFEFSVIDLPLISFFAPKFKIFFDQNLDFALGPKKSHKKKGAILAPIEEEDEVILPEIVAVRDKNETPEEKKARKAAVKEAQRICREMKKQNKNVWKEETKKFKDRQAATNGGLRLGIRAIPI